MNKTGIFNLRQRIAADTFISIGITVTVLNSFRKNLTACIQAGAPDVTLITNCFYSLSGFACMMVLSLILWDIRKKESPFCRSVVNKLRGLAFAFFITGFAPFLITLPVDFFTGMSMTATAVLTYNFWFILLAGLIIGIVSEIFVYGTELQEDNDMIA